MNLNLYTLCVIYLVYSFLGWVGETVVATAKGRRFTNRGVASGPFCFVYGTAGVLITIGLNDQRTSLAALFFGSMIYATVVEWLTAKLLERIHHRRWWDYSDKKFNLDGYVCLQYSLLWGLLGMAAVRWGNDLLFRLCAHLPPLLFHAVVWVGMALADGQGGQQGRHGAPSGPNAGDPAGERLLRGRPRQRHPHADLCLHRLCPGQCH